MRKLILTLSATALLAAPAAASPPTTRSPAASSTGRMANHFDVTADPARTWLGYATNTSAARARPTARITPIAPATLTGPTGAADRPVNADRRRAAPNELLHAQLPGRRDRQHVQRDGAGVGTVELTGTLNVADPRDRAASSRSRSSTRRSPQRRSPARCARAARRPPQRSRRSTAPTGRSSTSTSPTRASSSAPDGSKHDHGHRPGQHRRQHHARRLPGHDSRLYGTMTLTLGVDDASSPATAAGRPAPPARGSRRPAPARPADVQERDDQRLHAKRRRSPTKAEVHGRA